MLKPNEFHHVNFSCHTVISQQSCSNVSLPYLSRSKASSPLASLLLMAINLISPQHPSRWGQRNSSRRSQTRWWMNEIKPCWCLCFAKHPQLCLRIIPGQHQWVEPHISPRQPWWLRALSHPVRPTYLRWCSNKLTKYYLLARLWWHKSYESLKCILEPCWFDLGRVATDVLCCCFASNCSLFICGVFTEEPWRRQFSVTCRETGIKTLLILILIIPTWNIWNKTAM